MKNMGKYIAFVCFSLVSCLSFAQTGVKVAPVVGNPDASAMLEVESNNKGVLIPRIALTGTLDAATIANPANSLLIFNTATAGANPTNVTPGFYYWNANQSEWVRLFDGVAISSTDNQAFDSLVLNGTSLTGYIENGGSATTDLFNLVIDLTFVNALKDSIDTDVDSAVLQGDTALVIYENGKAILADLSGLNSEWIDGSKVGLTPGKIFAKQALNQGDTTVISNTNGYIGVGTASPTARVEAKGGTRATIKVTADSVANFWAHALKGDARIHLRTYNETKGAPAYWTILNDDHDGHKLKFTATTGDGADVNPAEVVFDTAGQVGIGTLNPSNLLHAVRNENKSALLRVSNNVNGTSARAGFYAEGESATDYGVISLYPSSSSLTALADQLVIGTGSTVTNGFKIATQSQNIYFSTGTGGGAADRMVIDGTTGNVGIGTATPTRKLDVVSTGTSNVIRIEDANSDWNFGIANNSAWGIWEGAPTTPNNRVIILPGGNLGIGVPGPTEKLHVAGNVKADTFFSLATFYPDYVFEDFYEGSSVLNPSYKFESLQEIEKFIKQNHHLPGVTSVSELDMVNDKYQVDLSNTSIKNLEKIEELYLHLIQVNKEKEELKEKHKEQELRIQLLEEQNNFMQKQLEEIKRLLESK